MCGVGFTGIGMRGVTSDWIAGWALVLAGFARATQAGETPPAVLASIRLYNPTSWEGPTVVEVPVGRLAVPGWIDWGQVRLVADGGREVPFALREGCPHWKARLAAPVAAPRAEDLLVFSCPAPRDAWARLDLVSGPPREQSALSEEADRLVVFYPGLRATIQRATGMLAQVEAFGEPLLDRPLAIAFQKTAKDGARRQALGPPRVRLVSKASNGTMTEVHFVLDSGDRLSLGVTYRIHACGLVEILSDERPWQGQSPWVDHSVDVAFRLIGQGESLPYLVNRAPFYGFKDYEAAVKHAAAVRRRPRASVLEVGEETTNGRRWNRRLYCIPADRAARTEALVEAVDKGVVVDVVPVSIALPGKTVRIAHPRQAEVPARMLAEALRKKGVDAKTVAEGQGDAGAGVVFKLVDPREAPGIEHDGFEIRPQPDRAGIRIVACARFGLMQAAVQVSAFLARPSDAVRLPLIAGNPAVRRRGVGFGGGDHEVDFPLGPDAEWEAALEELVASGMNVMADLGMWSNWKMPVSYHTMPELRSAAADAYDEVSGAKLAEFAAHREHGLKLLRFLHDRGVTVWLWLPVGCVPTTYAKAHPEAMAPGNDRCPCFTHPLYNQYLQAFLKELLETYPIDGVVMIRDDNGGLCPCERCKAYIARSSTKSAAWEQYLILYRWFRAAKFAGDIAVYPYFDHYEPRLDPLLPADLLIVGHGSGAGMLARSYETLAPMGDTWLDNVLAGFRVPTAARMRRLLADRSSFWLGGAFRGSELAWQAIGRFGWEPTATVSSLRYEWGAQRFGVQHALAFVNLADAYERMWEIYDLPMLPQEWVKRGGPERREVATQGRACLDQFRERLATFRKAVHDKRHDAWFRHLGLFATYFDYHLRRLEALSEMCEVVAKNRDAAERPEGLPEPLRRQLIEKHRQVYELAQAFDREAATVPGNMMARTRAYQLTLPFKEWVGGYDLSLEGLLEIKQFAGSMAVSPEELPAGRPFVLRIELRNRGVCPWMAGVGHRLELRPEARRLGLPAQWDYQGPAMVFGDRRVVELRGIAPKEPGETQLHLGFYAPFKNAYAFIQKDVKIRWK